jgi:hypothetical protein
MRSLRRGLHGAPDATLDDFPYSGGLPDVAQIRLVVDPSGVNAHKILDWSSADGCASEWRRYCSTLLEVENGRPRLTRSRSAVDQEAWQRLKVDQRFRRYEAMHPDGECPPTVWPNGKPITLRPVVIGIAALGGHQGSCGKIATRSRSARGSAITSTL